MSQIEREGQVRTKIVATVGPASRDLDTLCRLIDAGVDVFRLNFSHGDHAGHSEIFHTIREAAARRDRIVAVLQDLCGPKIRLGSLAEEQLDCMLGDRFVLREAAGSSDPKVLPCASPGIADSLEPGENILFADGLIAMRVVGVAAHEATLEVTLPGRLRSRQGIHLPGATRKIAALTEKDLVDLDWTARHEVDYVGLSFVRSPADVQRLREELARRGSKARIIAKIEKREAVDQLEAILEVSDALMVARGDLGVELDVARVPGIQKRIIAACQRARIPVITATQMLNSMESSNRPTRAEASDVYNAVIDGTDAVMLSGETAVGQYPVEAVATMSRILHEAEHAQTHGRPEPGQLARRGWITEVTATMVEAAALVCRRLNARLMVIATRSGRTALALSKHSSFTPTLAMSDDPAVARAMALYWGVMPVHSTDLGDPKRTLEVATRWGLDREILGRGDRIVFQLGTISGNPVHNAIVVHIVDGTEGHPDDITLEGAAGR